MEKKMNEPQIRVTFKNEHMETVFDEVSSLTEYTDKLCADLQHVIPDVESLIYLLTGKQRADWGSDVWHIFNRIRHKLLDKAGEISRIHDNLLIS